jgi:hypothetical protein
LNSIEQTIGRYVVKIGRDGNAFVYDIVSHDGLLVATGIDLLSSTADTVFEKLAERYGTGGTRP